ncbi:hypothetical protein MTsPCn9_08120 [Croceitalea sp. MTPC9]|uniref:hypothetical protein n=1 Tax=unclassified Croceitalea TaxID=2632280 RepID=UPI002B3D38EE|nr:hypothetical protein MTsPCn6_00590 [Croceitalea sp. MTPC6]GMN15876.1 hypothetical protein MTsPCn9_08120 [Croceitalea sp. MTPC9]
MKALIQLAFLLFLFSYTTIEAQYGYGNRYGNRGGRNTIPQAQTPPKEPEAKTSEQVVDEQMPKITETLELDPFEEAVVRSTLVKYVQKRMELQILKLEPQKMREEYEKLAKLQDEEMKAGLPEEKYEAYLKLQKNQFKAKKKKKKKKKAKS